MRSRGNAGKPGLRQLLLCRKDVDKILDAKSIGIERSRVRSVRRFQKGRRESSEGFQSPPVRTEKETLAARVLKEEHRIYSEAIAFVLSGKYRIEGRRVLRASS